MKRPALLLALAASLLPGQAAAAKTAKAQPGAAVQPAAPSAPILPRLVSLSAGKSQLLRLPFAASRLAVGDTAIADVILLNASEVYLLGKRPGTTNLILWDRAKQATIIDLGVAIDTGALRLQLQQLFPDETQIALHAAADTLVLSGTVADAVKASQIMALAQSYAERASGAGASGAAAGNGAATAAPAAGGAGIKVINMLAIAAPQQVMLEVK
ncbi:MAG: pilus assembly protein N-terminal domain-containing protein, partial [Janthinobacterium sp.]